MASHEEVLRRRHGDVGPENESAVQASKSTIMNHDGVDTHPWTAETWLALGCDIKRLGRRATGGVGVASLQSVPDMASHVSSGDVGIGLH